MLFLSDLDRTLIFSYKRLGEENLCVEQKDGKKLSYMTHHSAELLCEISRKAEFIPVTTRSMEQYKRIIFPSGVPQYAVTDNGGNLLINGVPDTEWRREAEIIIRDCMDELDRCAEFFRSCEDVYFDVRLVDDTFVFTKCHDPAQTLAAAAAAVAPVKVSLFENGEKIYAVPNGINKGYALDILKKRLGGKVIAAGDSLFDRCMLEKADISIIKNGELTGEKLGMVCYTENGDDPDYTLDMVKRIIPET